jgi:hypothetical protein
MNGNSLQGDTERCGTLLTAKTQMPGHVRDGGCGGGGRARGLGKRGYSRLGRGDVNWGRSERPLGTDLARGG